MKKSETDLFRLALTRVLLNGGEYTMAELMDIIESDYNVPPVHRQTFYHAFDDVNAIFGGCTTVRKGHKVYYKMIRLYR